MADGTAAPTPGRLRGHLVASGIAGQVATSRGDNLRNIGRLLDRHDSQHFGLELGRAWTSEQVLAVMAERVGIAADPSYTVGQDLIDPDLVVTALDRMRDRLALAARRRERVLLATGHPGGVLQLHLDVAAALRAAGCEILQPDVSAWSWPWEHDSDWARRRPRHVRCLGGVHVLAAGADLLHTHAPDPGRVLLAASAVPPDLVVADHGFAGVAAQAGIETLAYADSNDPALFVAEAEGLPLLVVPLDDNVRPHLYAPLSAHLTTWPAGIA